VLPARRMAMMVYHRLVESTAMMQREVALQIITNQFFGPDALPVGEELGKVYRGTNQGVLRRMRETPDGIKADLNKRIQDNIAVIEEFEKLFAEAEDADIKDFAAAMAARWKGGESDGSPSTKKKA
jgi:hypothetical protein